MDKYKFCKGCNQTKPHSEYYKDNRRGRLIQSKCKACQKSFRLANQEKIKQQRRDYYYANKESILEYQRNRYKENPESIKARAAAWRRDNPEKFASQLKSWRLRNPEKHNNAGSIRRARKKSNGVFFISKKQLKRLYASPCFYCNSLENITLDHVVPIALGGRHSIGNIVPACRKCNISKSDNFLFIWSKR